MLYLAFNNIAKQLPQKIAVVVKEQEVSYGDLDIAILRFSEQLIEAGVKPGNAVLILLPNGVEFVIATLATMAISAIAVPVNIKFQTDEIKYYIESSNASFVIHDGLWPQVSSASTSCKDIHISFSEIQKLSKHKNLTIVPDSTTAAIYMYSSGSTGKPKRITRTHGQLITEAQALTKTIELTREDNILCTVPLYHAHGFGNCLMASLLNGGTLVIIQGEFNSRETARVLDNNNITIYPAVPFMFKMLSETFFKVKPQLKNLRLLISAGAALPAEVGESFRKAFDKNISQLYGSTETGAVAVNYHGQNGTESSVGLPLHGFKIDILDESGAPVHGNTIGEIAISSPSMTKQYDGLPEITAECFVNGYFLPGDLGCKDVNGNIYIKGRKKLLINVAGYKVDPLDVEQVISKHPKVADVVVLGQADPNYGEMVKAVVVSNSECSAEEIIAYCSQHLVAYKIPKIVTFRSEIPRSPLGKILRKYLQDN